MNHKTSFNYGKSITCKDVTAYHKEARKSMRTIVQSIKSELTNSCVDAGSGATEENVN